MDQPPLDQTAGLSPREPPGTGDDFAPLRLVLQPTGAVIEVRRPDVVVGRHSTADIRLTLPDVSRRHCRLCHADGRWEVVDLKSLNGVWVNQEAVERAVLQQGDLLRLGGFTFMVDLSRPVAAADEANDGVLRSIFSALPAPEEEQRRRAS
jgi:pSer/pThr/pTyr-binding forkhead associated (FHA) protein